MRAAEEWELQVYQATSTDGRPKVISMIQRDALESAIKAIGHDENVAPNNKYIDGYLAGQAQAHRHVLAIIPKKDES